jgi:rod shape-determining protein MreC
MLEFLRRNRVLATTALFLALAAGLVVGTSSDRLRDDRLGRVFLEVMAPLQRVGSFVSRSLSDVWLGVVGLFQAADEVEALRARVRELDRQTARLAEVELENSRLRELLDFRETLRGELLTARVIGHDAGAGSSRTLTINRGTSDGVHKGDAVLAPEGIVGHVFLASPHAARVLLITDHNSGVDGVVQRTRARGIVEGTVEGRCGLKFVKRTEDLQVGDLVVTSGLDGIFPRSVPIGKVVAVDKKGQGLFQYAEVQPAVDANRLEEVLVTSGVVEPIEEEQPLDPMIGPVDPMVGPPTPPPEPAD